MIFKNCSNLEGLNIKILGVQNLTQSISLPKLKYLQILGKKMPFFSECYNLIELYFVGLSNIDNNSLEKFLKFNSLKNLKVVYLENSCLTKYGFKILMLNCPKLEKISLR